VLYIYIYIYVVCHCYLTFQSDFFSSTLFSSKIQVLFLKSNFTDAISVMPKKKVYACSQELRNTIWLVSVLQNEKKERFRQDEM